MPFVDELERELHKAATARERRSRRRWSAPFMLAPAAALTALFVVVLVSGAINSAPDLEEPRGGGLITPPRLIGSYETTIRRSRQWSGDWELFIRGGNARLLGMMDGAHVSLVAGKLTFRGDEVTFRVDLAHARNDPWPEPICARQRRDTPGTYRILARSGGAFRLRRVSDPCEGRAAILTGDLWRRVTGAP